MINNPEFPIDEAIKFFGKLFGGSHHVPKLQQFGLGWKINVPSGKLATYDGALLTHLVFLAHDEAVRIELCGSGPGMVGVVAHKRNRDHENQWGRHPTIDTAIEAWRKKE